MTRRSASHDRKKRRGDAENKPPVGVVLRSRKDDAVSRRVVVTLDSGSSKETAGEAPFIERREEPQHDNEASAHPDNPQVGDSLNSGGLDATA